MSELIARPAWATPAPWFLNDVMEKGQALEMLFGADLTTRNVHDAFVVYTPGTICNCLRCHQDLHRLLEVTPGCEPPWTSQMYVCAECGYKRCEKARDHAALCQQDSFIQELVKETK